MSILIEEGAKGASAVSMVEEVGDARLRQATLSTLLP